MSRVHLYKRLTAITCMSPSEFIRQIRLRHAEQLLSRSQLTVAEVAYKVGFNNPRYLSKYFKEQYGVMPSEYKGKLNNTKQ
jgi:AraC-like DNA-binding protein